MPFFDHSKFLHVFLYQNGLNKFRICIFGHYEFIPVFLEKIQNSHFWPFQIYTSLFEQKLSEKIQNSHFWPFQIYTSFFWENCQKKFRIVIFGHSKFIPVFLGKIVRKNLEWPFLAILNLY